MISWYGLVVSFSIYFFPGAPPGIWEASKSFKALSLEDQLECIIPAIEICIILVIITETFQLIMR